MEHIIGKRQVVLNFSELFCKNEVEVLNSACFKEVWERFLDHIFKVEKQDVLKIINILFKLLFEFEIKEIKQISRHFALILDHRDILYELLENFYDYWRRLERYGVIYAKSKIGGIEAASFTSVMNQFTNVVLSTYRTISQKVLGESFAIYRSLPAGINAGLPQWSRY